MHYFYKHYKIAAVLSGLLAKLAVVHVNFLAGLIFYVPLFIVLKKIRSRQAFIAGYIFGFTISLSSLNWMIGGSERFSGSTIIYGLLVYILSSVIVAFYFAFLNFLFSRLQKRNTKNVLLYNSLLICCIYGLGEFVFMLLGRGMPWFGYHSGSVMMKNLYGIQTASIWGIHGISFIVVLINYLIAEFVLTKNWKKLFIPVAILVLFLSSGYFIYNYYTKKEGRGQEINIAILCGNIEPEIRWNDSSGNFLVNELLTMNRKAVALKPDLALWSESAIPWTYREDDDLVNELLKISKPVGMGHILGMNTDDQGNYVYNSVYSLDSTGAVVGRYDKRVLLSFIEKPVVGLFVPFFSSNGFLVSDGQSKSPIPTDFGNAGVMICNESAVPTTATDMVKNGAEYMVNVSNDGWFNNTYLVDLHLYNVRMRAVETRKDIAINSNNGYSGLVKATGKMGEIRMDTEPFILPVTVFPNTLNTLYSNYPYWFILFLSILSITLALWNKLSYKK